MRIVIDLPDDTMREGVEVLRELVDEYGEGFDGIDAADDLVHALEDWMDAAFATNDQADAGEG